MVSSLMFRPPPISTLFPYTTLFRSVPVPVRPVGGAIAPVQRLPRPPPRRRPVPHRAARRRDGEVAGRRHVRGGGRRRGRSEEHTSELQSHVNLVCRLLLEKKK